MADYPSITLALAGIIQATALVHDIAEHGELDEKYFQASINSILSLNSKSIRSIYGNESNLTYGLERLIEMVDCFEKTSRYKLQRRYFISLLQLESKLKSNAPKLALLRRRLEHAIRQADYFHPTHPQTIAGLAQIYYDTVGDFSLRIKVVGKKQHLTETSAIDRIRALLLAGLRATVLWRQVGGSPWQLLFQQQKLKQQARTLLSLNAT